MEHKGGCVKSCPEGYEPKGPKCVECVGLCPKSKFTIDSIKQILNQNDFKFSSSLSMTNYDKKVRTFMLVCCFLGCKLKWDPKIDFLNAANIRDLEGCTSIDGHLRIIDATFNG